MNEKLKKLGRLGVVAGFALGGIVQTGEVVRQHEEINGLRQTITGQGEQLKKDRQDILNMGYEQCLSDNLLLLHHVTLAGMLGIPPPAQGYPDFKPCIDPNPEIPKNST